MGEGELRRLGLT